MDMLSVALMCEMIDGLREDVRDIEGVIGTECTGLSPVDMTSGTTPRLRLRSKVCC